MSKAIVAVLLTVLVAVACSRSPEPRASTPPAPSPSLMPTKPLSLYGGTFRLPADCIVKCVLAVDAHHGTITCPDLPSSIDYGAAFGVVISRAFEPDAAGVDGSQRVGEALVYWGHSADWATCVIVTYPVPSSRGHAVNHQFCTNASDPRLGQRMLDIAKTYAKAAEAEPATACEFVG